MIALRRSIIALAVLGYLEHGVCAEETPALRPSQQEIVRALSEVGDRYGPDVALLEGLLLTQAIEAGSIEETVVSIDGVGERLGRQYLQLRLETGIVYNDAQIDPEAQPGRLWQIIETCVRRFPKFTVPADGMAIRLLYKRLSVDPSVGIREALRQGAAAGHEIEFLLPSSHLGTFLSGKSSTQELLDHSTVLVNGVARQLRIAAAATPAAAPAP